MRSLPVLVLAACSAVYVRGPEVGPTCTTSEAWPLIDAASSGVSFAVAGVELDHLLSSSAGGAMLTFGLLSAGVIYAVSAVSGHSNAYACRAKYGSAPRSSSP